MSATPFRQLHHICIVVHDIEQAAAYYESIGIGPWESYPPLTGFTTLNHPNPSAFLKLKYRFANLDNVQLQLCEPPDEDCAQRRFLQTRGEGVFHLGFERDLDTAVGEAAELGLPVQMEGRRDNGTGFVYYDTLAAAGVELMNRQTLPVTP